MAALGRVLSTLGWLWFGAGIVGPIFGLDRFNVFPGLILIFIGRGIRAQARRRESEDVPEPAAPEKEARPLNTDRAQSPPTVERTAEPVVRTPPILLTPPSPPPVGAEPEEPITEKLFSKIGSSVAAPTDDETMPEPDVVAESPETKNLSSEEMIARARERWDRRR